MDIAQNTRTELSDCNTRLDKASQKKVCHCIASEDLHHTEVVHDAVYNSRPNSELDTQDEQEKQYQCDPVANKA